MMGFASAQPIPRARAFFGGCLSREGIVGDPGCKTALDIARRVEPLARGEIAAIRPADEARKLPDLAFRDASGHPKTLPVSNLVCSVLQGTAGA
jgi:hypothetical protein